MSDRTVVEQQITDLNERIAMANGRTLVDILKGLHPSYAHQVIRDRITPKQLKGIKADKDLQAEFNSIRINAMRSYEHDNRMVTNKVLDTVMTQIYGILVKMIKAVNDDVEILKESQNEVRARLGMVPLQFNEDEVAAGPIEIGTQESSGADVAVDDTKQ